MTCVITLVALAAPAPAARRGAPHVVPGTYRMSWGGEAWTMTLHPDRSCEARQRLQVWRGVWRYDHRTRVLSVVETLDGGRVTLRWQVKLDGKLAGRVEILDLPFRLWWEDG